ncbi:MAG: membrane protein insertion efficiency factor YidD [Actinomycetota bacterium]|nr:membrane protein insertion efficiency factor YidD [Actinomycetota bacterium]
MMGTDTALDGSSAAPSASSGERGSGGPDPGRDPGRRGSGRGWGVRLAAGAIRTYQLARSGHVSPCRFTPTCSQYALEAVEAHGTRRGVGLALRRLGRCRPGGPSGYDPVPE